MLMVKRLFIRNDDYWESISKSFKHISVDFNYFSDFNVLIWRVTHNRASYLKNIIGRDS